MEIDELNAEIEKMEKSIANAKKKVESCEKKRKKLLQEVYNNKYLRLSELQICYVREIYRLDLDRYDVIDFKGFSNNLYFSVTGSVEIFFHMQPSLSGSVKSVFQNQLSLIYFFYALNF